MEVIDEDQMLSERLSRWLEAAGRECMGLSGAQVVQLLGGLSVQLEASLFATLPRDHHDDIEAYLEQARPIARHSPLMTLQAERITEA